MKNGILPMNLQFFAEPATDPDGNGGAAEPPVQDPNGGTQPLEIDYEKLSSLIAGKQSVTEDTVLKSYFKQQGLSKEEMDQAITAFKKQKAESTPDIGQLQSQAQEAQQMAIKSQMENMALMMHQELGVDLNTIPYVMKLAELSGVVENGSISKDKLKEALNKVLTDVPNLKIQNNPQQQGFRPIGAPQSGASGKPIGGNGGTSIPAKKWNRFN